MIKIISHRGNIDGRNYDKENSPSYIEKAIEAGFDVEVDVWMVENSIFLGHDEPLYLINKDFISSDKIWCHAKNKEALNLMQYAEINCFWHESDAFTITSKKNIWCYPGNYHPMGITVLKENKFNDVKIPDNILGICTDFPINWRNYFV